VERLQFPSLALGRPRVTRRARITEKGPLWRLHDAQANTGMLITESFAIQFEHLMIHVAINAADTAARSISYCFAAPL
jgi:hypothetical protein